MAVEERELITDDDRALFHEIAIDIRQHPEKYREAGKWLDENYYSEDEYWRRKKLELENIKKDKHYARYLGYKKRYQRRWRIKELESLLEAREKPNWLERLEDAYNLLIKLHGHGDFITDLHAKCILLITWLLTDTEAEKANLNITQFESWPWSSSLDINGLKKNVDKYGLDFIALGSRNLASSLLGRKGGWIKKARVAWAKIQAEEKYQIAQDNQDTSEVDEIDEIDKHIIKLYQEAEKQAANNPKGRIKLPGSRKIAKALKQSGITSKEYSHEGIRKRIKKLREIGLIGHPDDNAELAHRHTNKNIADLGGDGKIKQKF